MQEERKKYTSRIWKAIIEFSMLKEGDRVLIGLSGGKDSMFMAKMLSEVKMYAPFKFELFAYTVDPGFTSDFSTEVIEGFCDGLGIKYCAERLSIADVISDKGKHPCFTCSYFRRGAINRMAKTLGCNKVALAHNQDDAMETFFMNIVTSGQLKTFLPVMWLSKAQLHVIRPLVYYREKAVLEYVKELDIPVVKNPCPYDGHTMRQTVKERFLQLEDLSPNFYANVLSSMREAENIDLWEKKLSRDEERTRFLAFWGKGK